MDIFFQDPSETPLPPGEVRIRAVRAEPWEDGRRVRIALELDPFLRRPSLDLTISDAWGKIAARASVIESMLRKIELTMHLRGDHTGESLNLLVELFYPAALPEAGEAIDETQAEQREVVDRQIVKFFMGNSAPAKQS
jgi:hypothetical protein